jgi:histidine triad (HIT) family protein
MEDCIFCRIVAGQVPAHRVYENDAVVAFLDISPVNKGHVLVVPRSHHSDLLETPDDVAAELVVKTKKIAAAVMKAMNAEGFNVGINAGPAAGQAVFHTHLHIIPRFANDGLKPWPHRKIMQEEMQKIAAEIRKHL